MGKRGPAKTPTAIAKLRGNPGKERLNKAEPAGFEANVDPPAELTAHGRELWGQIAPFLSRNGMLTTETVPILTQCCQQWDMAKSARADINEVGLICYRLDGTPMINPAVNVEAKALAFVFRVLRDFGCTPSSKTGLTVEPPKAGEVIDSKKRFFR